MATVPSKEDTAHVILEIFVEHFKSRPGHVLRINNFTSIWHSRGLASEDFNVGMDYAVSQGWVDAMPSGDSYKLTETGYSRMATLPTPEETAREILEIFVGHFNSRPGHVLRINNFTAVWHSRGLASEDFKPGMEYAVAQGWVDVQSDGDAFKLTDAGFAEA
ncbi:hypothetical protein SAMN04487958_1024 [Vreelandella subterranea]|uniref:Uncharacterized protein n=1 Tax=Vreelandella subterranea TaxID=416874 RepID=A0A1H9QLG4_9GAMM|nr:hypothetical protein [Halomonas subterranea]SER61312.1 hypothetical protein SAMN04487958_1024 [Halomonas subterranea]